MIKKLEQRAINMNLKKAVAVFLITCFVLMIAIPAALYGNFQNRISDWEQVWETEGEHGDKERESWGKDESWSGDGEQERDFKEREEKNLEEIHGRFYLDWSDFVLLACCAMTGMALVIWYWLLVMLWAYHKAHSMGINGRLAVLVALFFNLVAVAFLYLYAMLKGTCVNCGKVKSGSGKFCSRCGNPMKKECPWCRQEVDVSSVYCGNCGKRLDKNKEIAE